MSERKRERLLNRAFVNRLEEAPEFLSWLLSRTKFAGSPVRRVELPWEYRWYKCRTTGIESETDIFLVFEFHDSSSRFALHIENKSPGDTFRPNQPELYHSRAKDWINDPKRGNYQDYEAILIAPSDFYLKK